MVAAGFYFVGRLPHPSSRPRCGAGAGSHLASSNITASKCDAISMLKAFTPWQRVHTAPFKRAPLVLNHRQRTAAAKKQSRFRIKAASESSGSSEGSERSSSGNRIERFPIFPLSIVALPAAECPLHIFEARYRVLFSTLLSGSEGIDEGLVAPDKPWLGTRKFGLSFFDNQAGGLASVGTVLHIQQHALLDDGRMLIESIGKERYKILNVVEQQPVLVCDVEVLPEDDDSGEDLKTLAGEVAQLYRDVARISMKLRDAPVIADASEPPALTTLGPRDFSFWVASLFSGAYNQQALLEIDTTTERLKAESELLGNTLKYLTAQSALQSAFTGAGDSGSGGGEGPPAGSGPD
jgi:Lon protease-like protein